MSDKYEELSQELCKFIEEQKIFFVGTAASIGNVNISPKGMDSLRIINNKKIIWLNVTGTGNESAAHVQINPRMTIMFCAFLGAPMILRLYGKAKAIHKGDIEWDDLYSKFNPLPGARQIFDFDIELVQSSCGYAVPYFDYKENRELLNNWADKKGDEGIKKYWIKKNQYTIDGIPTLILLKNKMEP